VKSKVRERVPTRVISQTISRHVAGPQPGAWILDVGVRRDRPIVAVGADAHLGRDVAEQAEAVGPVDQVAGVVGVGVRDVAAVHHAGADLGAALTMPSG
jgi:hypothetical protein